MTEEPTAAADRRTGPPTPTPPPPPALDDTPSPEELEAADGIAGPRPISTNDRPRVTLARDLKDYISQLKRRLRRKGQELREARKYLDNIVRSMVDALIVIDTEGIVRTVNPATQELLGWKKRELVGKPASMLFANPADADSFSGAHSDELMSAGMIRLEEVACRHRDGVTIPVSFTASAMRDEDGGLIGFVGIARDIRELKRLEQEKIRAIRALAASVAHEIRNPLGAIQNSTGLLRRDLAATVDAEDAQLLDIVAEESDRIASIVTDFLNFARPSEARFTDVDLVTLVNETVLLAQQDSRCRDEIRLDSEVAPDLPTVRADPDKLRQVIWNLLINALEAIPRGEGEVTVRLIGRGGTDPRMMGRQAVGAPNVKPLARPGPGRAARGDLGYILVEVTDTGVGMDESALERAFEPFRTTKARGTGLGLAVVKSIIEEHGGTVRIVSGPDEGTSVSFTLPLRQLEEKDIDDASSDDVADAG